MKREFVITIDVPDWAQSYATDLDGRVWLYEDPHPHIEPDQMMDNWIAGGDMVESGIVLDLELLGVDWTKTLHRIER